MIPQQNYHEFSKQDFSAIVETLTPSDPQKHFLRSRWLNQVLWMERETNKDRALY